MRFANSELEPIKLARQEGDELRALRLERDLLVDVLENVATDTAEFKSFERQSVSRVLKLLEAIRC